MSTQVQNDNQNIEECIRASLENYFRDTPCNMYDMLLRLVEKPLLDVVMQHAANNQSKASQWLGLNRNTLRKKLLDHGML